MLDLTYHDDGRVTVNTGGDPGVRSIAGWSRYSVGLDLGRSDPTALVVIKDECLPVLANDLLVLGPRRRTVVFHETIVQTSYTDIAGYLARFLSKLRAWVLSIDSSGLGGPFSDQLLAAGIEHWAVTMTGGDSLNRDGYGCLGTRRAAGSRRRHAETEPCQRQGASVVGRRRRAYSCRHRH